MKTLKQLSALVLLFSLSLGLNAQDYGNEKLNLPGDNLNLYAVMDLFRSSETLEGFERSLNAEDSKINNLDLNGDNLIDYIKVIDYVDGEDHTIVLQVAINAKENQDVAVFTVFKDKQGQVLVQLIGDEYLYGKDYIIEPNYAETPNPGYAGDTRVVNGQTVVVTRTTYVEVQAWPVVRYIYLPSYRIYRSPWYWGYYPSYWDPWHPYYWDYYYGYQAHYYPRYYGYYHHVNHYRYPRYTHNYYDRHRVYSSTVHNYRESGRYKETYSRPDQREVGSNDYIKRYGDSGRAANPSAVDKPGRTTQGGREAAPARTTKPDVNNRSAKPNTRSSTRDGSVKPLSKPDSKREAANPELKNRSAKPANNRETTKPDVKTQGNRQGNAAPSSKQDVNRTQPKSQNRPAVKPDVKNQGTRQGTTTRSSKQNVNRTQSKSQERPAAKPSVRKSGSSKGTSGSTAKPSGSRSSKSAAPKSEQSGKTNQAEKKSKGRK